MPMQAIDRHFTLERRVAWGVSLIGLAWFSAPQAAWTAWLISAASVALAWWSPAGFLVLLALVAPFEQAAVLPWGTIYTTEAMLAVGAAAWIWHAGRRRAWRRPVADVYGPAILFALSVGISALWAFVPAAAKGAVRWLEWLLALMLCVHFLRRGREAQAVIWALACAAAANAWLGLVQVWRGPAFFPELGSLHLAQREITRAAGTYGANTLALLLALVMPWVMGNILWPQNRGQQLLAAVAGALISAAWVLTFSLTGWVAFGVAAGLMMLGWGLRRGWGPGVWATLAGVALLALLTAFWGSSGGVFFKYKWASWQDRLDYLAVAGRLFQTHPWFGIGPGMYRWLAPTWGGGVNPIGILTHPHSLYLTMLVELGCAGLLLGLAALFRTAVGFMKRSLDLRRAREYALAWTLLAGLAGFAAANLLEHGLVHDRGVHAALFLGAALVWIQRPPRPRPGGRSRFEALWRLAPRAGSRAGWEALLAGQRQARAPLYDLLQYALPRARQAEVLELGSGPAWDALNLAANRKLRVTAVDISAQALAGAREAARYLGRELKTRRADVRRTGLPGGRFDLVFSQGLLEHFPDPDPLWMEMKRLVKPGGFVVVDVPQTLHPYTLAKQWHFLKGDWPWGWETQYTAGALVRAARRHGLERVKVRGYGYRGGIGDITAWLRARLQPRFPAAWAWLEEQTGAYWMMNVVVLFRHAG